MRTLVLVPTYNESANIDALLRRVRTALPEGEILVIDDSSPDGTAQIAARIGDEVGAIFVLERPEKTGLGDAYRAGMTWGLAEGFDLLATMDADFSHDPDALPQLVAACEAGADIVIGSRYIPGASIHSSWPKSRQALSRWANRYVRAALRVDVADATAGFKVYRADLVRRIQLEESHADGYAFQIESIYRATSAGAIIREVPITFTDRTHGHSKLSWKTIVEALGLVAWWGVRARAGRPVVEFDAAGTAG